MNSRRHKTIAAGVLTLAAASPVVAEAATPLPSIPAPAIHDEGVARVFPKTREHRPEPGVHKLYKRLYKKVERRDGTDPGRNIVADGVHSGHRVRPALRSEVARSVRTLKKMLDDGATPAKGAKASGGGGASSKGSPALEAIAACESGGDPGSVGGGGAYRGKYQFDQSTWAAVGGSGDPAAASESEQDTRAAQLYAQQGTSAWPTCGQ